MGDASTKFFHTHATISFRRNLITHLVDDSGQSFSRHEDKASMIWNSFKDRLGKSEFNSILFDLNQYFSPQMDFLS
jgi:two-component SAPR family response regulator